MPSPVGCRNALWCLAREARGVPLSPYNHRAEPGDSPLELKMTGRTIEMRPRVGLPAIFAAFFRLGVASFGGGTEAWLYREIVERRR
jgi:hypothetical protein